MAIKTERIAGEPIIVLTFNGPPDRTQFEAAMRDVVTLLQEVEPVFVINNLSNIPRMHFSNMMAGIGQVARGGPGSAGDLRTRHLLVGTHEMVKFASEAIRQKQYGQLNVPVFASLQEALDHIRSQKD
jgi:hypothetical protein